MEFLTWTNTDSKYVLFCHVWGCTFFVLDTNMKWRKKTTKWNLHSRLGKSLVFSDKHYALVENIKNSTIGYISPQYHIILDDFQTICGTGKDEVVTDSICNPKSEHNIYFYVEEEFGKDDELIYILPWLYMKFGWTKLNFTPPKEKVEHKRQITEDGEN